MANIITGIRVIISFVLLFCPALTHVFYILYSVAGISDMTDGAVARRTGTVSESGAKLDTAADLVFAAVCMIKLLPVVRIPFTIYIWIIFVAIIKLGNIAEEYIRRKQFAAVHSALNKVTGGLCFVFPFTLSFIDPKYSAVPVCLAATAAALHERYLILSRGKAGCSCAANNAEGGEY